MAQGETAVFLSGMEMEQQCSTLPLVHPSQMGKIRVPMGKHSVTIQELCVLLVQMFSKWALRQVL